MTSARFLSFCLLAACISAGSANAQPSCPNSASWPFTSITVNDGASVGLVGHVNNGTFNDVGTYRAVLQFTASPQAYNDLMNSVNSGCNQSVRQISDGSINILGNAAGRYIARFQVFHVRPAVGGAVGFRRPLAAPIIDRGVAGATVHTHTPQLSRALLSRVRDTDEIEIEVLAEASGTVTTGSQFDQVNVQFLPSNLTPSLELTLP